MLPLLWPTSLNPLKLHRCCSSMIGAWQRVEPLRMESINQSNTPSLILQPCVLCCAAGRPGLVNCGVSCPSVDDHLAESFRIQGSTLSHVSESSWRSCIPARLTHAALVSVDSSQLPSCGLMRGVSTLVQRWYLASLMCKVAPRGPNQVSRICARLDESGCRVRPPPYPSLPIHSKHPPTLQPSRPELPIHGILRSH